MRILGIETTCDETSCAVVDDGKTIYSNVIYSQVAEHNKFGGVVPELACRYHIEAISTVLDKALKDANCTLSDIDCIAVAKGRGLIGAFFMGLASGLVVGPCTAPVLGVLFTYVAAKQNLFFGISLMFSFALGMGVLFIVIGTFSATLTSLPKAGKWMETVKKVFGFVLLAIGEYFLIQMGKALI